MMAFPSLFLHILVSPFKTQVRREAEISGGKIRLVSAIWLAVELPPWPFLVLGRLLR
jgi:hypothetical protein